MNVESKMAEIEIYAHDDDLEVVIDGVMDVFMFASDRLYLIEYIDIGEYWYDITGIENESLISTHVIDVRRNV